MGRKKHRHSSTIGVFLPQDDGLLQTLCCTARLLQGPLAFLTSKTSLPVWKTGSLQNSYSCEACGQCRGLMKDFCRESLLLLEMFQSSHLTVLVDNSPVAFSRGLGIFFSFLSGLDFLTIFLFFFFELP